MVGRRASQGSSRKYGSLGCVAFGKDDLDTVLSSLSNDDVDRLVFGAIELDRTGKILRYNAEEGQMTGRDPEAVTGKKFFAQAAPCTNRPAFRGECDKGVARRSRNAIFSWIFDCNVKSTQVKVRMKGDRQRHR